MECAAMECAASAALFWNGILWSAQPRLRLRCHATALQKKQRSRGCALQKNSAAEAAHSKSGIMPPHSKVACRTSET